MDSTLEVEEIYSLGSARTPGSAHFGMNWGAEVQHSPVDWNLLGIVLGSAGCAATEADPVRTQAASYMRGLTHCGGQDRLGNVEGNHRLDVPVEVEADRRQAEDGLHVVVPCLWTALHLDHCGADAVLFGRSLLCPIWSFGHHSYSL